MKTPSPLARALEDRVRLLATTLRPASVKHYKHTVRCFLAHLTQSFPEVRRPDQLRRDPHLLSFFAYLWKQRVRGSDRPCCAATRAAHLIRLRRLFDLLADHAFPPR